MRKGILVVLLFAIFMLVGCSPDNSKSTISTFHVPSFVPKGEKILNIQYNRATDVLLISFNDMTIFEGTRSHLLEANNKLVPGETFNISSGMSCQWFHYNATNAILITNGQSPTLILISSKTFDKATLLKVASSLQ